MPIGLVVVVVGRLLQHLVLRKESGLHADRGLDLFRFAQNVKGHVLRVTKDRDWLQRRQGRRRDASRILGQVSLVTAATATTQSYANVAEARQECVDGLGAIAAACNEPFVVLVVLVDGVVVVCSGCHVALPSSLCALLL